MKSNFQKIAVLCTCTGLLCSCGQSDNKQEHHKEFIPITILHPTTIEFPRSYVADVQAIQFVEIKPKVEGFVQKIYVDEGQKVKKGQPLFQLYLYPYIPHKESRIQLLQSSNPATKRL